MNICDLIGRNDLPTVRTVMFAAYLLLHVKTNKVYVGSSSKIGNRIKHHLAALRRNNHDCPALQSLYNDDPNVEFIYYVVRDKLSALELEKALIMYYNSKGQVLNLELDPTRPGSDKSSDKYKAWRAAGKRVSVENSIPVNIESVEYLSLREAARALGIHHRIVKSRINSTKLKYKDWLFSGKSKITNSNNFHTNSIVITVDGVAYPINEYAKLTGVNRSTLRWRRSKGVPDDKLHLPMPNPLYRKNKINTLQVVTHR